MALLFVFSGTLLGIIALVGLLVPTLRNLEALIPDWGSASSASRSA